MYIVAKAISVSLVIACAPALAGPSGGPYEITSYTIDAGGTSSATGGAFELSGTIGQPDAAETMTGGPYTLAGGFWPGVNNAPACIADLTGDGQLNFFDVSAFLSAFSSMNPIADFTGDGQFNFFDVSAFLGAFAAGCP